MKKKRAKDIKNSLNMLYESEEKILSFILDPNINFEDLKHAIGTIFQISNQIVFLEKALKDME